MLLGPGMLQRGKSFMRLWWCNQAKVRFGGWGHAGLDRDQQGKQESESAESRDMEVASAIFAEASWCSQSTH